MKGFLQRIAAAAIRPEPRLKPLVGSIYAGDPGMDFAEEKPSLVLEPPLASGPQASLQTAAERVETRVTHRHAHEPSPRELPVHHEPLIAMPQHFPPSLASVVTQLTAPRQSVPAPATSRQTVPAPATQTPEHSGFKRAAAESVATTSLAATHSGPTEEHSLPLPAIPPPDSASQQSERRLEQFMPIATRRELPQLAASTAKQPIPQLALAQKAAQANTGEEIQIHIGRIEVIAVPQSGTAAPASSRSRATSLDDYLKRRNGRAG
jgi:hypothetical protein